jgi:hypothetical protein
MRAALATVLVALCGAPAWADDRPVVAVPASEVPIDDEEPYVADFRLPGRLVIGFDFGIGIVDLACGGCHALGGIHLDAFAGVQVARRVALLADGSSLLHILATDDNDSGLAAHGIASAGARVWLVPRLWVQAGGGIGRFSADQPGPNVREYGPAMMIAIGGEQGHKVCSGIDLSLRAGGTVIDAGGAVGRTLLYSVSGAVGFHWN